jgi:endoglucanase
MNRMRLTFILALCLLAATPQDARSAPLQDCHAVSREACAVAHDLGRGINLGNMLEAPREGDWGVRLEPRFIELATRHFQTVRLPVRWSNHAAPTADARLDEAFARRVDGAVDALLARGVRVILNVHHYTQLTGGTLHPREFAVDPAVLEERLVNLWRQIAWRHRHRPPQLLFELLNEPHGTLEGEAWNRLAARLLAAVRASNPTRVVLIGPGDWNHPRALPALRLPDDAHLIVAIHSYDPFEFTHQGVPWRANPFPTGTRCCDEAQRVQVVQALDAALRWNRTHGVPVHLGEFGAYRAGDLASRAAYARFVRDEAERRGIGWAWWEWASDFSGVYDPTRNAWVEPLRRALLD